MTCARTQGFLAKNAIETLTTVDAKKSPQGEKAAFALLKDVDEIHARKGAKVTHLDLRRERPDREALRAVLLGPTGNLRAPTVRVGRTLLVGFDEEAYRKTFRR